MIIIFFSLSLDLQHLHFFVFYSFYLILFLINILNFIYFYFSSSSKNFCSNCSISFFNLSATASSLSSEFSGLQLITLGDVDLLSFFINGFFVSPIICVGVLTIGIGSYIVMMVSVLSSHQHHQLLQHLYLMIPF